METVFIKLLNMSISAGWLVLAVMLFRVLFKRVPKWANVTMWALVGIRLVCPFSLKSIFSLIPSAETVPEGILYAENPEIHSGIPALNSAVNPVISDSLAPSLANSVNPVQVIMIIAANVWILGIVSMLVYMAVSFFLVKRKVREAFILEKEVWQGDGVTTPFILGIIKPKIYLPATLSNEDKEYVVAHERAHIKRGDHLIKPFAFLLLSLYWFNPLMWAAYVLLCRDIELACDEKVVKSMGEEIKKPYSEALVNCSAPSKRIAACPLAFGETGVKARIKNVLRYKKPALALIILSVLICTVLALCFLTDPVNREGGALDTFIENELYTRYGAPKENNYIAIDYEIIGTQNKAQYKTLYMWVLSQEYSFDGTNPKEESGSHIFTAITVKKDKDTYKLVDYFTPRDGSYYVDDIRVKVPLRLYFKALDSERYFKKQNKRCLEKAREYFSPKVSIIGGADGPTDILVSKKLTLEKLIKLSEKGEELTRDDFKKYYHYDTGSGIYIEHYPIDDRFYLSIGYLDPDSEALYIYLSANTAGNSFIDVRDGGVEEFIEQQKALPIVTNVSAGWNLCPVGAREDVYAEFIKLYGIPRNAAVSSIRSLPTARIESKEELDAFINNMKGCMDFNSSFPDKDNFVTSSFYDTKELYGEEFFSESTLFLLYICSAAEERYTVDSVTKCEGTLCISLSETVYGSMNTGAYGWLMCVSVPKDALADVGYSEGRIIKIIDGDGEDGFSDVTAAYVYTGSADTLSKSSVMLHRNGEFQMNFSPLSSYLAFGYFSVQGDYLILCTDDGQYTYVFKIEENSVVFDAKASSRELHMADIPDGAVFELALPFEPTVEE